MENKPLVSVCCLAYNHEPYIVQALEGFMMQKTNFSFEVLLYDDASTDGTADIIRDYEKKYPRIFKPIYQTENQFSKGIKVTQKYQFPRVQGKYIAMCEGDDYWTDPLKLQKQVDFLEANEEYALCCHHYHVLNSNEISKSKLISKIDFDFTLKDIFEQTIAKTLTVVFRRSFIDFNVLQQYHYARDTHLIYHLLLNGKGRYFAESLGVYRLHQGGVFSVNNQNERLLLRKRIYAEMLEFNPDDSILAYYKNMTDYIVDLEGILLRSSQNNTYIDLLVRKVIKQFGITIIFKFIFQRMLKKIKSFF